MSDLLIDATDPNNLSNKVMPEQETRRKILNHAKQVGCEGDMLKLFGKIDKLMKNCTNAKERDDIGKMGAYEVWRLLGGGGQLYVDGQLVADDENKNKVIL